MEDKAHGGKGEIDIDREADRLLLSRFVPASVVINSDLEILRFRGATAMYFEPTAGKASLNLLKMVRRELVFERFYRVAGSAQDTYQGLGLGLYISSEIIKRQNGKIWVESKKGRR